MPQLLPIILTTRNIPRNFQNAPEATTMPIKNEWVRLSKAFLVMKHRDAVHCILRLNWFYGLGNWIHPKGEFSSRNDPANPKGYKRHSLRTWHVLNVGKFLIQCIPLNFSRSITYKWQSKSLTFNCCIFLYSKVNNPFQHSSFNRMFLEGYMNC